MTFEGADRRFFWASTALLVFGLIALSSASSVVGYESFGDTYYFLKRQFLFGLVPGLLGAWFIWWRGFGIFEKFTVPLFIGVVVLLVLVFAPGIGQSHNTFANRWVEIAGLSFQPSELAKLIMVIYAAAWLSKRHTSLADFRQGFLPYVGLVGLVVALIVAEPDLGTAGVITLTLFALYFYAGGKVGYLAGLGGLGALGVGILIMLEPYRLSRLTTFFDPTTDPQGIGYHASQAFLAIGSGGFWGKGFGQSRAKFQYLPEVTGDSIFAVVAEELGFLVALGIAILFCYLLFRTFTIASKTDDSFGKFLVVGIGLWLTIQAYVNISAMVGLVPLTGVPLPFVSYGGTALASVLVGVATVLAVSAGRKDPLKKDKSARA